MVLNLDRRILVGAFIILILGFAAGMKYTDIKNQEQVKKQALMQAPEMAKPESKNVQEAKDIKVYVTGAVKTPGVYTLKQGDRVYQAVDMAGGMQPEADARNINMAALLHDGQNIAVPKKGEASVPSAAEQIKDPSQADNGLININTASLQELDKLNGIGPSIAQRIIDFRQTHGPFERVEDIKKVSGIGEKKFQEFKDQITVN